MTLLTHLAFSQVPQEARQPYVQLGPPGPWASLVGLGGVLAVLISSGGFQDFASLAGWHTLASVYHGVLLCLEKGRTRMSVRGVSRDG